MEQGQRMASPSLVAVCSPCVMASTVAAEGLRVAADAPPPKRSWSKRDHAAREAAQGSTPAEHCGPDPHRSTTAPVRVLFQEGPQAPSAARGCHNRPSDPASAGACWPLTPDASPAEPTDHARVLNPVEKSRFRSAGGRLLRDSEKPALPGACTQPLSSLPPPVPTGEKPVHGTGWV